MDALDRRSYVPLYRQLARVVQSAIEEGELLPGEWLPPERELAIQHGVGVDTVRDALKVLRARKLVVTVRGVGTHVSQPEGETEYPIPKDARITARPATAQERQRLRMSRHGWVFVVQVDGEERVLPADRTALREGLDIQEQGRARSGDRGHGPALGG